MNLKLQRLEEDVAVISTFSLQEKQVWTGEKMLSLVGSYETFKEKVFILAEHDSEYKYWLQTTGQSELAGEWGIDQSTISRLIGPIQREHKNALKEQARTLRADGMSIKGIIDELQLDVDESTVRRWIREDSFDMPKPKKPSLEGSTEYDLKIYKLEADLKKEKQKVEEYRKEIKSLKAELRTLRAKYA
jgi:hypothetical protein